MTALRNHQSATTTKLLLVGNNGAGKTGALASLAAAGYNLRILDLDNGMDVLANLLRQTNGPYPAAALDRVEYQTITDPMRNANGKLIPAKATAWTRAISLLSHWKTEGGPDLGPVSSWGSQDVLVIDSLTMICTAALNFILSMNARLGQQPHQSDWYAGQQLIEGLLQMLYDEGVKCNVIVNCHITFIGEDGQPAKGYPATLGRALSPKVGTYFNTILMARETGSGATASRKILTNTTGVIELKNTAPLRVAKEYPIETGLADYFKAVRGDTAPIPATNPTTNPGSKPAA